MTTTFHEAVGVLSEYVEGRYDRVTPGGSCEVVNCTLPPHLLMLVRFKVKSVEPEKTSWGRRRVEGVAFRAKLGVGCCW